MPVKVIHAWWFGYTVTTVTLGALATLASLIAYDVWLLTQGED